MNSWIILLLLLMGRSNSGCGCQQNNNRPCRRDGERGGDRDRERNNRGRERDRDSDDGCGCNNDSGFEPRFDSRSFGNRETCGCEENDDQMIKLGASVYGCPFNLYIDEWEWQ